MLAPLDRGFNVAILHIASKLFPCGFDVSPNAPDTLPKLQAHIARTGRMLVWDGASDRTIFGCPEVNYAFRAWHDWCHYRGNHEFTPEGERACADMQAQHIRTLYGYGPDANRWCELLNIEVNGQLLYASMHNGAFPTDQRAFADMALRAGLLQAVQHVH